MSLVVLDRGYAPAPAGSASRRAVGEASPDLGIRDLAVRYGQGPDVFSGVSFEVSRGEAVALVGANGAGKSTLLKCCLGFVAPTAGTIALFGEPLGALGQRRRRKLRAGIGFVAQKHNLVGRLSVFSNVVHGLLSGAGGPRRWCQALAPRSQREEALAALDRVGLADLASRRADSLSGGQSQRVAIARALVAGPRLILADEPVASLDPAAGEEVMRLFLHVVRDSGVTLVFTTHNLAHALDYGERVVGLGAGGLALDAPSDGLALGELRELYG